MTKVKMQIKKSDSTLEDLELDVPGKVDCECTISGTDLNTVIKSGFYRLNSNNTNAPGGTDYSQMLVVHGGADTIAQIIICYTNNNVWVRAGNPLNGDGSALSTAANWRSWIRLASTADIPSSSSKLYMHSIEGMISFPGIDYWFAMTMYNDSTDPITDLKMFLNNCCQTIVDSDTGYKTYKSYYLDGKTYFSSTNSFQDFCSFTIYAKTNEIEFVHINDYFEALNVEDMSKATFNLIDVITRVL